MTSKLSMDQGEQEAALSIKVINESYKDTGLFGVQFTAADNRLEDAMWYSLWNLVRCVHKMSQEEVEFAKVQLKSKILAEISTPWGLAENLAKCLSCYGRPVSPAEMFMRIDSVDTDAVRAAAKAVINDNDHALAATGPLHELPDYNWIRRRSFWQRY
jgi:processing peptidase subunit beta